MSLLPRLILISGWAHLPPDMNKLRDSIGSSAQVSLTSSNTLWDDENKNYLASSYAYGLKKLIKKTGRPIFIAGWSLGGMIALETATHWPDLISGLILIGSTAKFCKDQNWEAGVHPKMLRAMTAGFKRNADEVLKDFYHQTAAPLPEDETTVNAETKYLPSMNRLELACGLEYLLKTDLRAETAKMNIPTLILHGKMDAVIPVEAGLNTAKLLTNVKIKIYENYGHGLPCQNPQQVADDIMRFIEEYGKV